MSRKLSIPSRPKKHYIFEAHCFCEGLQEKKYFEHFAKLINNCSEYKIKKQLKLNPKNCKGGDQCTLLNTAINQDEYNSIVIFDYDNKKDTFEKAIDLANKHNFKIGYSNINFDYWLVLHLMKATDIIYGEKTKITDYQDLVRNLYHLPKDADIKKEDTINKILVQIELKHIINAIKNCELIDNYNKTHANTKSKTTPNGFVYYGNPDIQIYKIIKFLLQTALSLKL